MYTRAVLAACSVAALCATAAVPALAGAVDPDFDWRDDAFSAGPNGEYGQAGSSNYTSSPGVSGENRYIHQMTVGGVSTTVTIEAFNPQTTYYKKKAVMSWDGNDGIGVTQKDPDYTDYEPDEIEGKNEILRFSFSNPVVISAIHVADLFKNEKYNGSHSHSYDEWGYFRLNDSTPGQTYDQDTFKFTADGHLEQNGIELTELIENNEPGEDNGEWIIPLPQPTEVSSIDFWSTGEFYEWFEAYCEWYKKYGDTEFALAGVDVVQPNQPPPSDVPEPGPLGLLVAGLLGLGAARYRMKRG